MLLVHSAIRLIAANHQTPKGEQESSAYNEIALRYHAYQTVCSKYSREIAAIQKYLPGWEPEFR